jgi:hypothetical protein
MQGEPAFAFFISGHLPGIGARERVSGMLPNASFLFG